MSWSRAHKQNIKKRLCPSSIRSSPVIHIRYADKKKRKIHLMRPLVACFCLLLSCTLLIENLDLWFLLLKAELSSLKKLSSTQQIPFKNEKFDFAKLISSLELQPGMRVGPMARSLLHIPQDRDSSHSGTERTRTCYDTATKIHFKTESMKKATFPCGV